MLPQDKNILEHFPMFGKLYSRVANSKNLSDILEKYEQFPQFNNLYLGDFDEGEFDFVVKIEDDFFDVIDQSIIQMRSNENYFDDFSKEEKDEMIQGVINYINSIISFVNICCKFTNKNKNREIVEDICKRIYSVLPEQLKKIIKISNKENKMNNIIKLKELVALANMADKQGNVKLADQIDLEIKKLAGTPEYDRKIKMTDDYFDKIKEQILFEESEENPWQKTSYSEEELEQKTADRIKELWKENDPEAIQYYDQLDWIVKNHAQGMSPGKLSPKQMEQAEELDSTGFRDRMDIIRRHGLTEDDTFSPLGDPYEYIYDIYSDNYVVVGTPAGKESIIGKRIGRGGPGYSSLTESASEEYFKKLKHKADPTFLETKYIDMLAQGGTAISDKGL